MSGIQKRTVYMVVENDHTFSSPTQTPAINFEDWATVSTAVGPCVEPFMPNQKTSPGYNGPSGKYDPRDQIAMINKMETVEKGQLGALINSGSETVIHSFKPQVFKLRV